MVLRPGDCPAGYKDDATSRRRRVLLALAGCVSLPGARAVGGLVHVAQRASNGAAVPAAAAVAATLDNNRMFVTVLFRRPDGSSRPALAWVNMGMGGLSLAPKLRDELGRARPVSFNVGEMTVSVDAGAVLPASADDFAQQLGPMPVEAILPAGVLRQFRVTVDYATPSLTLSQPSDAPAPGVPVPVQVAEGTGIISADAEIDGRHHPVAIDYGAGYSWWRGNVVRSWLGAHPNWLRAEGAPGRSNQAMVDRAFEQDASVVRVPVMALGPLELRDVGLLGSGPANGGVVGPLIGRLLWDAWERGAPGPVAGWIGGDVLARYRLTIDYRNRTTYWEQVAPPQAGELNSVGISLVHTPVDYRVGGLVRREGVTAVTGVLVGDRLVAVDGRGAASMTRGGLLDALHGPPGAHRRLTLDRDGQTIEADTVVNGY